MNEIKQGNHGTRSPDGDGHHRGRPPYWRRAHRSVGFWIAVVLMLAAMVIYVMSDDLAWGPRLQPRQPMSVPAGN